MRVFCLSRYRKRDQADKGPKEVDSAPCFAQAELPDPATFAYSQIGFFKYNVEQN